MPKPTALDIVGPVVTIGTCAEYARIMQLTTTTTTEPGSQESLHQARRNVLSQWLDGIKKGIPIVEQRHVRSILFESVV